MKTHSIWILLATISLTLAGPAPIPSIAHSGHPAEEDIISERIEALGNGSTIARRSGGLQRRAYVKRDCDPIEGALERLSGALKGCEDMSYYAAYAAVEPSAPGYGRFRELFEFDDAQTRRNVSRRLSAVSRECGAGSRSNKSDITCVDSFRQCDYKSEYEKKTIE